jgi:hypothetical protein
MRKVRRDSISKDGGMADYEMTVAKRETDADRRVLWIVPPPSTDETGSGIRQVRSNDEVFAIADELGVPHDDVTWDGGDFDHESD